MKPSHVSLALVRAIEARRPAFIWGPPGIGKSELVRQTADITKRKLVDIRAVLLDPVDLRGLPAIADGQTTWHAPSFLPRTDTPTLLFLDELNAAPQLVQAACYQLILDRALGEYHLPDSVAIVAAGNRETDRAVTSRMSSALANRFVHITQDVDMQDWSSWAFGAGIQPEVIAFIRFRPNLLHAFDPSKTTEKAFPSPRAWSFVSDLMRPGDLPKELETELIAGTVGEGAAIEFCSFLRLWRNLPNPDAVLATPDTADVPSDPATLYALCGALSRKTTMGTMDRLVTYANRLPAEFSVLLVTDSIRTCPAAQNTAAAVKWFAQHNDVLC